MRVGLTSGVWDVLHFGHLRYLESCKALCDTLLVGVDSDEMVRAAKGPERPFVPELERLSLIRAQRCVDAAFLIHRLEDLHAIALQFKVNKVFKHEGFKAIKSVIGVDGTGAELVIVPDVPGLVSTTELVAKIRGKEKEHVSTKLDLDTARACYFSVGGVESEIGPRSQAEWYWRGAALLWRDAANSDGPCHAEGDKIVVRTSDGPREAALKRVTPFMHECDDEPCRHKTWAAVYPSDMGGNTVSPIGNDWHTIEPRRRPPVGS